MNSKSGKKHQHRADHPADEAAAVTGLEVDRLRMLDELEPHLLALHRTMDAESFWAALQNLLDAAFPNQSIVAALRVSGQSPPVFYHTHRRPHHTHAWFTRTLMAHPCYAHLMANPGLPVLRLGEVLPPGTLETHPFYHDFMEPEGWFHGLAFVFWKDGEIDALMPVNRSRDQPDFSESEVELARWLHPRIEAALHRINQALPVAEAHSSLVSHLADLPLPTLHLCWHLKLVFANRAARTLLDEWRNLDPASCRKNTSSRVCIPRPIRESCAALKSVILSGDHPQWPPTALPPPLRITHPTSPHFTAMIRASLGSGRPLSNPGFWIHLNKAPAANSTARNLDAINLLSTAERAVVEQLALGLTNDEIAARLSRSISTVKAHLQSAYRKLGVRNRATLLALLHPPE